jgi:hypothetical protein
VNPPIAIYLAGPIDGIEDQGRGWRDDIFELLPMNVACFSPAHAFINDNRESIPAIHMISHQVIRLCDGMLVKTDTRSLMVGTIREIEWARLHGKPVVVVDISDRISDSLMAYDLLVADNVEQGLTLLLDAIREQRSVPHPLMMLRKALEGEDDDDS